MHRDTKQNGVCWGVAEGGVSNGYRAQVGDEKVLEMDSGDGCTTM